MEGVVAPLCSIALQSGDKYKKRERNCILTAVIKCMTLLKRLIKHQTYRIIVNFDVCLMHLELPSNDALCAKNCNYDDSISKSHDHRESQ